MLEIGYECSVMRKECYVICGDEIIIGEECEDGNTETGDGCSDECEVEEGFYCTDDYPSVCTTKCSDSIKAGKEECDDGNTQNDDSCDSECKIPKTAV